MEVRSLRWGLLACGNIAKTFADGLQHARFGTLTAVASRDVTKARAFAEEQRPTHGTVTSHGSYESLLADPAVDAVYISTPHPMHAEWTLRAAEAGKHVLCEKPAALNAWDAAQAIEACVEHGVVFCEAFMYRFAPHITALREIIQAGTLGEIRHIHADFGFNGGDNPESRLLSSALGGGGILDVGCYPMSIARLVAGASVGLPFADPTVVRATGTLHPTEGTDLWATASLQFPNGVTAQLTTAVRAPIGQRLIVVGTEARLEIAQPFLPPRHGGKIDIQITASGAEPEIRQIDSPNHLYAYEADAIAENTATGECPQMPHADTLGNLRALDAWRAEIALAYPGERAASMAPALRRNLRVRGKFSCPHSAFPGVDFPVSRLVLGIDNQRTPPHIAGICDDFMERGGNAFDTAYVYGGGLQEKLFGAWVKSRGVRRNVAVIVKGGHTPHCNPDDLSSQLVTSLDRLQTDHADLYFLHRDNVAVPVGEFVDCLNDHLRAGRIRAFGGSNWTRERIVAANAYAAEHGLVPMTAVSNNFSLARMVDPVWSGCVAASEPGFRDWLTESQLSLFAWSSQARGFFVRADPSFTEDQELVRCWYSEKNFERLARARQLAADKGCAPINIALAYVLAQPFPTFSLIGPRAISETRSTWASLGISLSPRECSWLDLREDNL